MARIKTALLGSLVATSIVGLGAAIGTYFVNKINQSAKNYNSSLSNDSRIVLSQTIHNSFSVTIEKQLASDETEASYKMEIKQDPSIKEASIYFIGTNNEQKQVLTIKPGETVKLGVKFNDDVTHGDKYTVRDLFIYGKDSSHFVSSTKNNDGTYSVKMPTEAEAKMQDGESWLYEANTPIVVSATFIKESIGKSTTWTHGAFHNDVNGYVYNFSKDTKWSEVKDTIYRTYENKNPNDPINIFLYLHGFNLVIDEPITSEFVSSGWSLHIYNNAFDVAEQTRLNADNKGYGAILPGADLSKATIDIKGSLHLGNAVKYVSATTSLGVRFFAQVEPGYVGLFVNDPTLNNN